MAPGHRGDVPFAAALVEGLSPLTVVADAYHDATHLPGVLGPGRSGGGDPAEPSRVLEPAYDA